MKNMTAEVLREPLPPRVLDLLPMTREEFARRYLRPVIEEAFNDGDLITMGTSKTRWRVREVVEAGVTMLRIAPAGRR